MALIDLGTGAPADVAAALERRGIDGSAHPCLGYAVLGLPFHGGDVLALRRFPSTAGAAGYTCVWHRAPDGDWTFYADVGPDRGCSACFGPAIQRVVVTPVRMEWTSGQTLAVAIGGGRVLAWSICIGRSLRTRLVSAGLGIAPLGWWRRDQTANALASAAAFALGAGRLRLSGRAPNGQPFVYQPLSVWHVAASRARLNGRDLGQPGVIQPQVSLGEFWIPNQGLFMVASTQVG